MTMTNAALEKVLAQGAWLKALAESLLRDRSAADDVVQETYLVALASPPQADRPVRPWLASVVYNIVRQWHRADQRRLSREQLEVAEPDRITPEEIVERTEVLGILAEEIRALREPERTVIFLRYLEQRDQCEIAVQLDVPESTVRNYLLRGREALREQLDRRFGSRQTWCVLLARFAGPGVLHPLPAVPAPMAAAAVLLLAGAAVWGGFQFLGDDGGRLTPLDPQAPVVARDSGSPAVREVGAAPLRAPAAGPEHDLASPSAVTGRVVFADGTPAAESQVSALYRTGAQSGLSGTTHTDEEGVFRVALAPMTPAEVEDSWFARSRTPFANGIEIRSAAHARLFRLPWNGFLAAPAPDADGTVHLEPFVVHEGTQVAGRVHDEAGRGAGDARLFVLSDGQHRDDLPTGMLWPVGVTQADGTFSLDEPLSVWASTGSSALTLLAIAEGGIGWQRMNLLEGHGRHEVVVTLGRATCRATVEDESGRPLAGARIRLIPPLGGPVSDPARRSMVEELFAGNMLPPALRRSALLSAATDASGGAGFDHLPACGMGDLYRVLVEHDGYATGFFAEAFSPGERKEVRFVLRRLRDLTLRGRVSGPGGVAVPDATITVNGEERITGDDGSFEVPVRAATQGGVSLAVRAQGFAAYHEQVAVREGTASLEVNVQLQVPVPTEVVVVDSGGRPIPGLLPRLDRPGQMLSPIDSEGGRFRFLDTTAGPWTFSFVSALRFDPPWVMPADRTVEAGDPAARIVLTRGQPARCEMTLDLQDALTGQPLDADLVHCQGRRLSDLGDLAPATEVLQSIRREAGALRAKLAPGSWTIWVHVPGRPIASHRIEVLPGSSLLRETFRLGRGATVRGRIAGAAPASAVSVALEPLDVERPLTHWIGSDLWHHDLAEGATEFVLELAPMGRHRLVARAAGQVIAEQVVEVGAAGEVFVPLEIVKESGTEAAARGWR